MAASPRVLLIEHLDAHGAAAADARSRAAAIRAAGFEAEGLVLDGHPDGDLLFAATDRNAGHGFDVLAHDALPQLAARVTARRATHVLWASAAPGGGEAARALPAGLPARWWATGHAPEGTPAGPLAPLCPAFAPVDGSVLAGDALARRRLALWDGPFVLLPALPGARSARRIVQAFADSADASDGVDLVVLAHPERGVEELARRAGVGQRVHFVGPAPREAEHAWLGTAVAALLPGDVPVSGGLVLRALASGCPLVADGGALARWFGSRGLAWGGADAPLEDRLGEAIERTEAVQGVRERGRHVAAEHAPHAVGAAIAAALRASAAERRAA